MTNLYDLLDPAELSEMIAEKRIAKQVHPSLPIYILNYSNRAQFLNKWTQSERVCRGLIVEEGTNKVIARGPEKFFNYGQPGAPEIDLDSPVMITQKEDGSLGIGWYYDGFSGVATRGSFTSDQAKHASAMLPAYQRESFKWHMDHDNTSIFEIVYPENRIVLDYGDRDELIDIGTVDNKSGLIVNRQRSAIKGRWYMPLSEALVFPIPADEEGYVLDIFSKEFDLWGTGTVIGHIKLKGEEYKILHGLLTNTNARRIWVQMAARACHHWIEKDEDWARLLQWNPEDFKRVNLEKDIVDTLLTNVPDEFYDWVTKKIDAINDTVSDLVIQAILLGGHASLIDDKRQRYESVKDHPLCREILNFVDSRDDSKIIIKAWQLAKPDGDDTPFRTDED